MLANVREVSHKKSTIAGTTPCNGGPGRLLGWMKSTCTKGMDRSSAFISAASAAIMINRQPSASM